MKNKTTKLGVILNRTDLKQEHLLKTIKGGKCSHYNCPALVGTCIAPPTAWFMCPILMSCTDHGFCIGWQSHPVTGDCCV